MHINPTLPWLAILSAATILTSHAAPREIKLRGVSVGTTRPAAEIFVHDRSGNPGTPLRVKSYLNHEYDACELEGNQLVLTNASDPASTGEPASVISECEIPNDADSAIVIFIPGSDKGGFEARLIDDSAEVFPPGSFLVVSQCDATLKVKLASDEHVVEPMSIKVIEPPSAGDASGSARMQGFRRAGDTWEPLVAHVWSDPGTKRILQVAMVNPRSERIEFHGLKDVASIE